MPRGSDRDAETSRAREADAGVGGDVRDGGQRAEHAPHGRRNGAGRVLVVAHLVQRSGDFLIF